MEMGYSDALDRLIDRLEQLVLAADARRLSHEHRCVCGNRWRHSDDTAHKPLEEFTAAHTCSECGREVYRKV